MNCQLTSNREKYCQVNEKSPAFIRPYFISTCPPERSMHCNKDMGKSFNIIAFSVISVNNHRFLSYSTKECYLTHHSLTYCHHHISKKGSLVFSIDEQQHKFLMQKPCNSHQTSAYNGKEVYGGTIERWSPYTACHDSDGH